MNGLTPDRRRRYTGYQMSLTRAGMDGHADAMMDLMGMVDRLQAERDALAAELERVRAENDRMGARELAWAAYEDYYVHELAEGYAPETFNEWYVSDRA